MTTHKLWIDGKWADTRDGSTMPVENPATGETIEEPLWDGTLTRTGKFTCPHCAEEHLWVKKDVILAR